MTNDAAPLHRERVRLPGRETDIEIGPGTRLGLGAALQERFPRAERFGLVVDATVNGLWPTETPDDGPEPILVLTPPGEDAKRRGVLSGLQDRLLALRRDEPVVAVGGGALLDVAGFAAATVRRGLPWIAVATSVVGMADASVGGKVAVNHRKGKNLLGTFHPPVLVLADPDYLSTLSGRDRTAGLAEIYKAGRIADPGLRQALVESPPSASADWVSVLARSVAVKARIVEADERDAGERRALNYGHTVGHALERLLGNERIRHGEAVAIGMAIAARLGRSRGLVDEAFALQQAAELTTLGLPTAIPQDADSDAILRVLGLDKKRASGHSHTFVLPRGDVGVTIVEDVDDGEVRAALFG